MCQYNFSLKIHKKAEEVSFSILRVILDNESEFIFNNFRRHKCAYY